MAAVIRGLSYPLQISNGSLSLSSDLNLVEEHIISVLETRKFERVMRASYGMREYIFETSKPVAINAQIHSVVMEEVTELSYLEVTGNFEAGDQGTYVVVLQYSVAGTPQPPLSLTLEF